AKIEQTKTEESRRSRSLFTLFSPVQNDDSYFPQIDKICADFWALVGCLNLWKSAKSVDGPAWAFGIQRSRRSCQGAFCCCGTIGSPLAIGCSTSSSTIRASARFSSTTRVTSIVALISTPARIAGGSPESRLTFSFF